ncbi:hypothetical protein GYA19_01875 [Candidatus Beckwithbacteria bacterium]|nr:hypothetical protein [Candidatus Beckwithbacteria bacterium]
MACRKAVIIFANDGKSYQHGDGMITSKNIKKIAQNNFSGRTLKIPFTEDNLEQELQKYDPQMGDFNQQFVKNNYDIAKNIQIILTIYQKASQEKALAYDKKQVDFIAQGFQEILAYEKLIYRYRPFGQLISRRLKDEIKDNLA